MSTFTIGGVSAHDIVKQYGTPVYVLDYETIKRKSIEFTDALKQYYPNSLCCYASKAFSCVGIYNIVNDFNVGADAVSGGEIYSILKSKLPLSKVYFHGNNKTKSEVEYALKNGVGAIVLDSFYEIDFVNAIAKSLNLKANVLLRVNPGIDAHTHHFVQTARVDSKFGFAYTEVIDAVINVADKKNLTYLGLHCHIGSQIFETEPYRIATNKMCFLLSELQNKHGIKSAQLNIGGGFGIKYTKEDKPLNASEYIKTIADTLSQNIKQYSLAAPKLIIEPGRAIIAESGTTLYTVGATKQIADIKTYVSIDGGMFDNPRFALYQAKYTVQNVSKLGIPDSITASVVGKCCESGDVIAENVPLPKTEAGDILAVLCTGAYNYSMASNYNKNAVPPVVLVKNGKAEYLIKPQTYESMTEREIL